jgi:hypothetical protein
MLRQVLRVGSRGQGVVDLQNLLNTRLTPSPGLATDGVFAGPTQQATLRFQRQMWLRADGIVGGCTWNALQGAETYTILHSVDLVGQPTPTNCWQASASMLLRRSITVPRFMLAPNGALLNDSELNDARISTQFCRAFGFRLYSGQSWSPDGLANVLRRGPVMCNVLWNSQEYTDGSGSNSHWVVFAGIRGDGAAERTTIRVYNPLPVSRGCISSANYANMMRRLPAATYQLFQRA